MSCLIQEIVDRLLERFRAFFRENGRDRHLEECSLSHMVSVQPFDRKLHFIPQHSDGVTGGFRVALGQQQADLPADAPKPTG
jgi:hypothetical protein